MTSRSHYGCTRCKKRRQKCDEKKPVCTRCQQAAAACSYFVTLKWNGRVPRVKGKPHARKPAQDSDNAGNESVDSPASEQLEVQSALEQVSKIPEVHQNRELEPLSGFSSTERLLLHHFVTKASMIASHAHLREQICSQIMPMILHIPSLLYATMALSGLHYSTLINGLPQRFVPEALVSNLINASLRHLRVELETPDAEFKRNLLHTVRTLCVCEIYSGKADSSWRIHVDGARAIVHSADPNNSLSDSKQHWVASRWYRSIEALSALTDTKTATYEAMQDPVFVIDDGEYYFDIYTGYSSDLNSALEEIGELARRRRRIDMQNSDGRAQMMAQLQLAACQLDLKIQAMIQRDEQNGLKIPPDISIQGNELRQFSACNTAYQHSALICIYRKVQTLSSISEKVQACVTKILDTVSQIMPMQDLSPWALLTTPIFIAG